MQPLEILDDDDDRADEVDDNKPIEVDTPRVKRAIGDYPPKEEAEGITQQPII